MAELGNLAGAFIGPMMYQCGSQFNNAPTSQVFNTANNGWCARILAIDSRDIKSVAVNFSSVTSPGTVTVRIETVDANGKPSGTLYDASATKSFTPAVGWNVITFDVLPTTGLTAGNQYAVVLLKDDSGTTCTLRSHQGNSQGSWPINALFASDATSRSNFTEAAVGATPIAYFVLEDDALAALGCVPSIAGSTSGSLLSSADAAIAQKIILPCDIVIRGVRFHANAGLGRAGTPANNLRLRILDNSNVAVSGTTVTIDKDTLTGAANRGLYIPIPPTTLVAGTYRAAFDSSGDGSNYFSFSYVTLADAAFQSSGFCYSVSADMSTSFTWTDTPTKMLGFGLELDSIPASTGGTTIINYNVIDPLTSTVPGI